MSETEQELADLLKQQCFENGKEKNPKSSAKLLHKLGLLYRSKSPDKQSLIQSLALMTSAIIREPDNVDVIEQDETELISHLLQLVKAKCGPELIREAVKDINGQVQNLRKATEQKLEDIKPIPDDAVNEDWKRAQEQKIKDVERLQAFVTKTYIDIMSSVCKHCAKVMGDAPCKFTLVGMGSLARKEITPYSDFESIIVLEEGVQHADDYDGILEYFRWFSTIFQIILIQLGETPLRFLAIPCLNDPLNSQNNWFYDEFTPCGICPDGFAPPACKNPLGRQMPTPLKPWTTELIKPVSEMLKYLDSDEDIKNGYHLADILMKTCYVDGCEDVYQAFSSAVHEKLEQQFSKNQKEFFEATKLQINEDIERYRESFFKSHTEILQFLDVKRILYRGLTLNVSSLGRLYNLNETSCLDILDKLCTLKKMTSSDSFKLKFAVSVSCEIRLRTYTYKQSQCDLLPEMCFDGEKVKDIQPIFDKIGAKAVVSCLSSACALQSSLPEMLQLGKSNKANQFFLLPVPEWMHVNCCAYLSLYEYGLKACQEVLTESKSLKLFDRLLVFMKYAQCLNSVGRTSEAEKVLKEQRKTASKIGKMFGVKVLPYVKQYYFNLGKYSTKTGKLKNGLKYFRKANFIVFKYPEAASDGNDLLLCMSKCYMLMRRYGKALKCLDKITFQEKDLVQNRLYLEVLYQRALCSRNTERFHEATSHLERITECRKMFVGEDETDKLMQSCRYDLGDCLYSLNKSEEALDVLEKAWKQEPDKHKRRYWYLHLKSYSLLNFGRNKEALPLLKELLELLESSNYRKSPQLFVHEDIFASCLRGLALCTYALGLFEESLKFSRRALEKLHQSKQKGKQLYKYCIANMRYVLITSKEQLAHSVFRTQPFSLENVAKVNFRSSEEEIISLFHIGSFHAQIDNHQQAIKYFKAAFNVLTKRTSLIGKCKSKESLFEYFSHSFASEHYRLLLSNSLEKINQDDEVLIQRRQAWREASHLDWSRNSVYRKCAALQGVALSFGWKLRDECLEPSEYLLTISLDLSADPMVSSILEHFKLYLTCRLLFFIDCSSLPYRYTPSIYHHVLHLLIDNPDICCYEWRDICREIFRRTFPKLLSSHLKVPNQFRSASRESKPSSTALVVGRT